MDNTDALENLLAHLGDFGKYQLMQFILHSIAAITASIHMISLQTVAAVPDHRCKIPDLDASVNSNFVVAALEAYVPKVETDKFDSCNMYNLTANDNSTIPCDSWVYDLTYYKSSRGMEWNFVCNRRWMGAVAQSVFMFGAFVGAVILGSAADKYGRKPIFCWSAILQLFFGVAAAFVSQYYLFLVVQFFYGMFGSAGSFITGFVLAMELVAPSKRTVCGITLQTAFAVGIILVAMWAAVIHDRQMLQLVYGLHGILLVGHWWWMDESPRWLWSNGKVTEAVSVVQKGLKINGSSVQLDTSYYLGANKINKYTPVVNICYLYRLPILRKRILNVCLAWFANSLVYYGLSFGTNKLYGNPFVLLCIVGLVEIPGYVLVIFSDGSHRASLFNLFFMIVGGICCIISTYLFKGSAASTTLAMLGKFSIGVSFATLFNYSVELFPTVIRNSALGLAAMSARISCTITPLLALLDSLNPTLPTTIFAVISIISGFLVLFLPETLGSSMPQTLQDGETFRVNDTVFTSCCRKKTENVI